MQSNVVYIKCEIKLTKSNLMLYENYDYKRATYRGSCGSGGTAGCPLTRMLDICQHIYDSS